MTRDETLERLGSYQRSMDRNRAKVAGLDAKIERLWRAYRQVGDAGEQLEQAARRHVRRIDRQDDWRGTRRQRLYDKGHELSSALGAYMAQVDACRDEIRQAINRLENEKADLNGSIGQLQRAFNDLSSWFDRTFN